MAFSASEAAFEGFRLIRREPGSVLVWALVLAAFSLALTAVMLPALRDFSVMSPHGAVVQPADARQALASMGDIWRADAIMLPTELAVLAVLSAAIYRAVLRPEDKGFGRLKLGMDELRLVGLWILMVLLALGFWIVVGTVALVGLGVALAFKAPAAGPAAVAVYGVTLAVYLWFLIRLSLAGPMTFAERRIRLFESWRLTRGRFWSLLGCYFLAALFVLLLALVLLMLEAVVAIAASGGSITAGAASLFHPDASSFEAYFTPARLVLLPLGAVLGAVFWTVGVAPSARAYQELAPAPPAAEAPPAA